MNTNIDEMTDIEAKELLKTYSGKQILEMFPASEIHKIVRKANNVQRPDQTPPPILIPEAKVEPANLPPKPAENSNPPPTLKEMATNFKNAMVDWKKDKYRLAPDFIFSHRLQICRSCQHWVQLGGTVIGRCKKCGCFSAKHKIAASKCPLNPPKWGAYFGQ